MCLQWLNVIVLGTIPNIEKGVISFAEDYTHGMYSMGGRLSSSTYMTAFLSVTFFFCSNQSHLWLTIHYSSFLPCLYTTHLGYIGEFEIVDDHRAQKIVIELNGRLNKCGVISPRFDVAVDEIEKWIVSLLPSRQFGHIILSTTYGIMTHEEARRKKTGGKILGFFYWGLCPLNKRKEANGYERLISPPPAQKQKCNVSI